MLTHITTWHVANIFILAVGGAYALAGVISPAQLTAFVMYSDHVLAACLAVCEQIAAILENIGSADAVLKCVPDVCCAFALSHPDALVLQC